MLNNKKYHLCGFGNGLVDLQFTLSDDEITKLPIKKGDMKLVDEDEQNQLITSFQNKDKKTSSGGSAANTIIAFSQLGGKAAYQTVLGNDEFGDFYANEFKELGIDLEAKRLAEYRTGTCAVLITPDGERTMHTHLGATAFFTPDFLNKEMIQQSEWLYIEGYELVGEKSTQAIFDAIAVAKQSDTKIAFSFSAMFIIDTQRANVEKIIKESDLLFCNDEEALLYTQTDDIQAAFEKMAGAGIDFVITCGKDGAVYQHRNEKHTVPCYCMEPIDTTGAGDMFAAGYLYGEIVEQTAVLAGIMGAYCAGKVVSQFGARISEDMNDIKNYVKTELMK